MMSVNVWVAWRRNCGVTFVSRLCSNTAWMVGILMGATKYDIERVSSKAYHYPPKLPYVVAFFRLPLEAQPTSPSVQHSKYISPRLLV